MWYDILVVCILLYFLAKGAARGLVWQLASIAGILLCVTFAGTASKVIGPHINLAPPTNHWAVMFITYLLASFVAFGLARTLNGWIEKLELKEYNRHLGAIFGLVKGALLVLIMTFMIVTFSEKTRGMLKDSRAAHISAQLIHQIEPIIPARLHQELAHYLDLFDATKFAEQSIPESEQVLPDDVGSPGAVAPVDDGTTLGQTEPFNPPDLFSGSPTKKAGTPGTTNTAPASDLETELRKAVGSKVTRMIQDELQNTTPQDQARLTQDLTSALQSADSSSIRQLHDRLLSDGQSGSLVQLMGDWATERLLGDNSALPVSQPQSSPASRNTTARPTTPAPRRPVPAAPAATGQAAMLNQIVALESQFPSIQSKLKAAHTQVLEMLPSEVSQNVLEDWFGDLTNSPTDLDENTNSTTPLNARIIRQLQAAGHSEAELPVALQKILKQFRTTADGAGVLR